MCPPSSSSERLRAPSSSPSPPSSLGSSSASSSSSSSKSSLLDKDWGKSIPNYIPSSCLSLAAFIMGITIKGDWLLFLSLAKRGLGEEGEGNPAETRGAFTGEWEMVSWLQLRFQGYVQILVPSILVGYVFYFGIGGFLHWRYYVGQRDRPKEWKCQPNNWLSRKDEIHEIVVGLFSLTLASMVSAGLATWVINGGYTSLYFKLGEQGLLWALLELPLLFIPTDYITYWIHRIYHMPFLYKHFHKLHHTYKQPTAFSVVAMHPVEMFSIHAVYIAPMFLMKIHAGVYVFYLMYIYYHGIVDHSGINFKAFWFQPWQPDCIFHDNHHQYFHVNFGFNMSLWDRLHGTQRRKDRIYREDIFWGRGKDRQEASKEERRADMGERLDENPLAYRGEKNKYLDEN